MRISSMQYFNMNVSTMSDQQAQLSQLYAQISSGVSLSTPSDNPLGAAQAVQLSSTATSLAQYTTNQNVALSSLQQEDSTLGSVNTVLQSIHTLVLRAGDGSLNDGDRGSIATQLQSLRSQLLTLANSTDPQGNALFGGYQSTAQPYTTNSAGAVTYSGDTGTPAMQITPSHTIQTGDNGIAIFNSVAAIGTSSVPAATTGNTGTGVVSTVSMTNPTNPANADKYSISFTSATTYTVTQTTPSGTVTTGGPQPFTAGSAITLGGQTVSISGAPNAGDSFTVTPATQGSTDVFANLSQLITTLQTPVSGGASTASFQSALTTSMTQLENTMNNVVTAQAAVGGREQQVQALQTVTQSNTLQTASNLADLTQTDMVKTIGQYTMTQNALQAAQQAFVKIQSVSLFQYLN
ncbi:flagellar hook-associated protein FlgL [Paraburkholderia fungorum]|jgi:flagellar hook-associated protein 3 FlgL|uniref:Flagellar hook-associated protein 3 n=1 Tax=Paraburkholderia fungorum TaxID=134537 RepID=A0AAP5QF98_9BURK|nr:flagellar hook-associated protein FlgL [Paraburkholderia fungorum]KFX62190.1 flagellar hook protein FlgL [Burkholderia sp. K24]AJZ60708.1 flagellar hook-associated protein 3 [Paraburkholderia fungorum]MBU7438791.1 flagellar hook-associated protein FlgL [Paraburkholderia fungorum]MDT8842064.1 flagellar hook-associated protein FlgL [Paraburkholderia fungorum]PRZ51098.1 flagellar hook-associated protein 3 FlgL [Paraburkholderia fungorum]